MTTNKVVRPASASPPPHRRLAAPRRVVTGGEAEHAVERMLVSLTHGLSPLSDARILADALDDADRTVEADAVRAAWEEAAAGGVDAEGDGERPTADDIAYLCGVRRCPICAPVWFDLDCRVCRRRRLIGGDEQPPLYNVMLLFRRTPDAPMRLRRNAPVPTHLALWRGDARILTDVVARHDDDNPPSWHGARHIFAAEIVEAGMASLDEPVRFHIATLRHGVLMAGEQSSATRRLGVGDSMTLSYAVHDEQELGTVAYGPTWEDATP